MTEVEVIPAIRVKFVASDGREFDLPSVFTEWFHTLGEKKAGLIFERSYLTRTHCKQLWEWLGRIDKVPRRLNILVCKEDLEAQIKKARK